MGQVDVFAGMDPGEVIRHMPVAALVVEAPSGRIVQVSPRGRELVERQLGRAVPPDLRPDWEIFHLDGRPYLMEEWPLIRSITSGEEVVNEECFNVLADGSRLVVRCSSAPIYRDGHIVGGLLVMDDITQRRSETILERITDAFVAVDRDWRYTYLNEHALATARMALGEGLTLADLLGKNCWEAFPELIGTTFDQQLRTALREQEDVQFEAYSPGSDSWLEVHVYPSQDGLSVYSRDISERRWAQEEIGRSVEQQSLVAELGLKALAGDDLDSLMQEAVMLVAGALDVELTAIAELAPGGGAIRMRAGSGWDDGVVGDLTDAAPAGSLWAYTLASAAPVVSEDIESDQRFTASGFVLEHGAVSGAGVMIPATAGTFGVLQALSRTGRSFSDSEVSLMQAVANVLATAIQRVEYERRIIESDEVDELLRFAGDQRAKEHEHRRAIEHLTPREHEVLQALAEGLDGQAIADRLHITTRTQRNHVANILTKLGVHSRLQAVLLALRYDIVRVPLKRAGPPTREPGRRPSRAGGR